MSNKSWVRVHLSWGSICVACSSKVVSPKDLVVHLNDAPVKKSFQFYFIHTSHRVQVPPEDGLGGEFVLPENGLSLWGPRTSELLGGSCTLADRWSQIASFHKSRTPRSSHARADRPPVGAQSPGEGVAQGLPPSLFDHQLLWRVAAWCRANSVLKPVP